VRDQDKDAIVEICNDIHAVGFKIIATDGTCEALRQAGVEATRINKVMEGRPHARDAIISGDVQLVFNTVMGAATIRDSFSLRQAALTNKIPYYTTVSGCRAVTRAITAMQRGSLRVRTIQSFLADVGT